MSTTPDRNRTTVTHDEATALAAQILGEYMADWTPEERAEALSDLESVTVYVAPAADEPEEEPW
jgi:hypothetical protein